MPSLVESRGVIAGRKKRFHRGLLHAYRVGIFVILILLIHWQHAWFVAQKRGALKQSVTVDQVRAYYPEAVGLSDWDSGHGGQNVLAADGKMLGYVLQTSPEADDVIGFSGPTNSLIAMSAGHRVLGVEILRSDDTREHAADVMEDESFLGSWNGLSRQDAAAHREVDGVSGATLTSMAVANGISIRLGGGAMRSRFPDEIGLGEVQAFLPDAERLEPQAGRPSLLGVRDAAGGLLGFAARTSPHADHMMGYQGPTDVLIVLDPGERVRGLALRESYDNQPFVRYVGEDDYFFNTFQGFSLGQVAQLDMVEAGIDGVSGATKTSISVAEGLIHTASVLPELRKPTPKQTRSVLAVRDAGTIAVVLLALVIAFTSLRGKRPVRIALQGVLVLYLGFINADMVSQALLVGWAQNGIAWRVAPGLVVLTAAALIAPILTGRQVYCTHLCPYGAAQDWLHGLKQFRVSIPKRLERLVRVLPFLLLVLVVVVAMGHLPVGLVGIEPFDAFVFRVAGWATIAIALLGLLASLFITRAYCRYGCPTGAMLGFVRLGPTTDRFGRRDLAAAALVALALGMMLCR